MWEQAHLAFCSLFTKRISVGHVVLCNFSICFLRSTNTDLSCPRYTVIPEQKVISISTNLLTFCSLFSMVVCAHDDAHAGYLCIPCTVFDLLCARPVGYLLPSSPAHSACIQLHGPSCRICRSAHRFVRVFCIFCSEWSEQLRYDVRLMSESETRDREKLVQFMYGDQSQQQF
jgi:hypothetical protein